VQTACSSSYASVQCLQLSQSSQSAAQHLRQSTVPQWQGPPNSPKTPCSLQVNLKSSDISSEHRFPKCNLILNFIMKIRIISKINIKNGTNYNSDDYKICHKKKIGMNIHNKKKKKNNNEKN